MTARSLAPSYAPFNEPGFTPAYMLDYSLDSSQFQSPYSSTQVSPSQSLDPPETAAPEAPDGLTDTLETITSDLSDAGVSTESTGDEVMMSTIDGVSLDQNVAAGGEATEATETAEDGDTQVVQSGSAPAKRRGTSRSGRGASIEVEMAEPIPEPEVGRASIDRDPLYLTAGKSRFTAPLSLQIKPPKAANQEESETPVAADKSYLSKYRKAANEAHNLYQRLVKEADNIVAAAKTQNSDLGRKHQSILDQNLEALAQNLAGQRATLNQRRTQTLIDLNRARRAMHRRISGAATSALDKLNEQYEKYRDGTAQPRLDRTRIEGEASANVGLLIDAPMEARNALGDLRNKLATEFPSTGTPPEKATNEAIRAFVGPRIDSDVTQIEDEGVRLLEFLEQSYECLPCNFDGGFQSADTIINNVNVLGKTAVEEARDNGYKSLKDLVKQLEEMTEEAFYNAEKMLVEQHDDLRSQMVEIVQDQAEAEREEIGDTATVQSEMLHGMAGAQSTALSQSHDMLEQQQHSDPNTFADAVTSASQKLAGNLQELGDKQPRETRSKADGSMAQRKKRADDFDMGQVEMRRQADMSARQTIRETSAQLTKQIHDAIDGLNGVPRQVAKSCDNYLPEDSAYDEAIASINGAVAAAGTKVTNAYENGPGGSSGEQSTTDASGGDQPNICLADGSNASTPAADSNVSSTPSPSSTPAETTRRAPLPASCEGCPPSEGNQTEGPNSSSQNQSGGDAQSSTAGADSVGGDAGGSSDGNSSAQAERRSPRAFVDHCNTIERDPKEAPQVKGFIATTSKSVTSTLESRASAANSSFNTYFSVDISMLRGALASMTPTQGRALEYVHTQRNYGDLRSDIRNKILMKHSGWRSTAEAQTSEMLSALSGNAVDAAVSGLTGAFNMSNDVQDAMNIMLSLTPAQMTELNADHAAMLNDFQSQLDGRDREQFIALRAGNTARYRALLLQADLDSHNRFQGNKRGYENGLAVHQASIASYNSALEGTGRDTADIFNLEDTSVTRERTAEHWQNVQTQFSDLPDVVAAIGEQPALMEPPGEGAEDQSPPPPSALAQYATREYDPYARHRERYRARGGRPGREPPIYRHYQDTQREGHSLWIEQTLMHGGNSTEARGARAYVETRRRDRMKPETLDEVLHIGAGDAVEGGGYDATARTRGAEESAEKRAEIFLAFERFRYQLEGGNPPSGDAATAQAEFQAEVESRFARDPRGRAVAIGIVQSDAGDPLAVIEHALATESKDYALTQLRRMDHNEIQDLVTRYNNDHPGGPSLYERLGLFEHHWSITNWSDSEFSGDDANALEIAIMGVPQNSQERAQVALRVMDQTTEQAGWLGKALAGDEYDTLEENARNLREQMGVTAADIDSRGRIRTYDPVLGQSIRLGNFDDDGNFVPPEGSDVTAFERAIALSRITSSNYTAAVDRIANFVTTALVIIAAGVTTFFSGGAAAAFWITLAAGLVGVGANAAIRGGRYSKDEVIRDVAMSFVQAATAGVAARASSSMMATAAKALTPAQKAAGVTPKLLLRQELGLGVLSGVMGNVGGAVVDPVAWRQGKVLENVGDGLVKGVGGGLIGAAAMRPFAGLSNSSALSSKMLGNAMGSGLGGAAGRAFELSYDSLRGNYRGNFSDAMGEVGRAGLEGIGTGISESAGEHARTRVDGYRAGRAARRRGDQGTHSPHRDPISDGDGNIRSNAPTAANDNLPDAMARPPIVDAEGPTVVPVKTGDGVDGDAEIKVRSIGGDDDITRPIPREEIEAARAASAARDELLKKPRTLDEHFGELDGDLRPIHDSTDLDDRTFTRLGAMPEGSRITASDPKSPTAARHNYEKMMQHDPHREVLMVRNTDTGEFLVIQGGPRSATKPKGPWIVERHSHPRLVSGELESILVRSLPSATDGDFAVLKSEVDRIAGSTVDSDVATRRSVIDIDIGGMRSETEFSITRNGVDDYDLTVTFHHPTDGPTELGPFKSIAEYETKAFELTQVDFSNPNGNSDRLGSVGGDDRISRPRPIDDGTSPPAHRDGVEAFQRHLDVAADFDQQVRRLRDRGDIDPRIGRAAAMSDAHQRVLDMGLVGKADSLDRLHLIMNDRSISVETRQAIADAVLAETRQQLLEAGQISADEPVMLVFHGATRDRTESIRQSGVDMTKIKGGGEDDFGRGFYLTSDVESAQRYTTKNDAAQGEIFPFILRGRDVGTMVDVSPTGTHRAAWEAFVAANAHRYGDVIPLGGEPRFPLQFGDFDAFGNRGRVFDDFLAHLAHSTGRPELATPDFVHGELGGLLTSGTGHGDQQTVRTARVANVLNDQMGYRRATPDGSGDTTATVRSVDGPETDIQPSSVSDRDARNAQQQQAHRNAVDQAGSDFIANGGIDGRWLAQLMRLAPETTTAVLRGMDVASNTNGNSQLSQRQAEALRTELSTSGLRPETIDALQRQLGRLMQPGGDLHNAIAHGAERAARVIPEGSLQRATEAALDHRLATKGVRQFAEWIGQGSMGPEMKTLKRANEKAVVDFVTSDAALGQRLLDYYHARLADGTPVLDALRDALLLSQVANAEGFNQKQEDWRQKYDEANIEIDNLDAIVAAHPDELLALAHTNPNQLAEIVARMIVERVAPKEPGDITITAEQVVQHIKKSQETNTRPLVSETSAVMSQLEPMNAQLLKADAVMDGKTNRGGLDIVAFSPLPGNDAAADGPVRVILMDDKALAQAELASVSAMTGESLRNNLTNGARDIETRIDQMEARLPNPGPADIDYIRGARTAIEQMRQAATELTAARTTMDVNSEAYVQKVVKILTDNNIELVISREYGSVTRLSDDLRRMGFQLEREYLARLAEELRRAKLAK